MPAAETNADKDVIDWFTKLKKNIQADYSFLKSIEDKDAGAFVHFIVHARKAQTKPELDSAFQKHPFVTTFEDKDYSNVYSFVQAKNITNFPTLVDGLLELRHPPYSKLPGLTVIFKDQLASTQPAAQVDSHHEPLSLQTDNHLQLPQASGYP